MTTTERADLVEDWTAWHAERESGLREPHGWLSLTALHWLTTNPAACLDLPGLWSITDGGVEITATTGDGLEVEGVAVDGTVRIEPKDGQPGVLVAAGARRVEVVRRTDDYALRVRDPRAITLTAFSGVPTPATCPARSVRSPPARCRRRAIPSRCRSRPGNAPRCDPTWPPDLPQPAPERSIGQMVAVPVINESPVNRSPSSERSAAVWSPATAARSGSCLFRRCG
jgi:hypothetical protein